MRIVRVSGTVTATVKLPGLVGHKLLLVDVIDGSGAVLERGRVAVDATGAGTGDLCLMSEGSAARLAQAVAGQPVDATLVAVIDTIDADNGGKGAPTTRTSTKGR